MKKFIFFLAFITGMVANSQVGVDTIFHDSTKEFTFVSDDGGGKYTVSGPGSGNDGFLAIYDENMPPNSRWEVKDFPPRTDLGSVHEARLYHAYTLSSGTTIAYGIVANNSSTSWDAIRRYENGVSSYSQELIVQANVTIFPPIGDGLYARVFLGNNGNAWNLTPGEYLVKIDPQDLSSPEWIYQLPQDHVIEINDILISTAKVYRYAVQLLPNGNIAVHVVHGGDWVDELWEFDPTTGQKLGAIDDSYTDYDRDGVAEMQYRFHRWKVVNGVLYHEFWQDPAAYPDDQQIGHWEKLEVPGYTPGGSTTWDPANLQVTAVSDWETYDSFGMVFSDFSVESDGTLKSGGYKLSPKLEPTTGEDIFYGWSGSIRDSWVRPNGDLSLIHI